MKNKYNKLYISYPKSHLNDNTYITIGIWGNKNRNNIIELGGIKKCFDDLNIGYSAMSNPIFK